MKDDDSIAEIVDAVVELLVVLPLWLWPPLFFGLFLVLYWLGVFE